MRLGQLLTLTNHEKFISVLTRKDFPSVQLKVRQQVLVVCLSELLLAARAHAQMVLVHLAIHVGVSHGQISFVKQLNLVRFYHRLGYVTCPLVLQTNLTLLVA